MIWKMILALSLLCASFMLLLALGLYDPGQIIGNAGPGNQWVKGPHVGLGTAVRPHLESSWWIFGGSRTVVVVWCWAESRLPVSTPETRWQKHGFAYYAHFSPRKTSSGTIPIRLRQLEAPRWAVGVSSLLFLVYPTIAFLRGPYCRHRRRKKGLCLKCGYNLTGNVSGVCPECGEKIEQTVDNM